MSALRKTAAAVLLAGAALAAGCADGGVFAPRAPQLQRAVLSLSGANAGGDASAFDRATAIQVRLTRSGATILDSVLAFTPAAETRVPIEVEIASSPETLGVEVELRAGASPVFRANGMATMTRGETTSLTLALVPVASALRVGSLPALTAIGESAQITGAVVFSTGDTIRGVTVTWTSATPGIVSVTSDGRVTATGEGQGQVIASGGGFTQTVPVTVSATVSSVTLSPRSPTVQVGGSVAFSAQAKDRNGNVLARTITFSSSNPAVAPINTTGTATAVMAGTTQIAAAVGSVRDTTTLTVTNPPPPTPANLVATAVSATQVNLSWTDNSSLETGFRIERCTGQGCSNFAEIGTVGANVTGYQDGGLTGATSYTYRIRAFNTTGTSGYSNPAAVTTQPLIPASPTNLAATAVSSSQINLAWSDNANNEDGFRVERCTGQGCSNFAEIASLGANVTSYQNGGLAEGTTYTYRVRAFNGNGASGYSNTASATTTLTLPAAPTNLTATAVSSTQINLAWVDNATNENAYLIERCTGAQCTSFQQITTGGANATAYQDLALAGGTTYGYRLRAYNGAGYSAYSNVAYATTPPLPTPPAAPTSLTATAVSSSEINLAWTDNANNETGFRVEMCQGYGCTGFTEVGSAGANVRAYASTGLAANTIYTYRVRAYNDAGNSAYSNTAYDTTFAVVTIPNPPDNLTATAVSSSQINLAWRDNSTNETGFRIERCTGATCTSFSEIAVVGAGVTSYPSGGLAALTAYRYRVRAYNAAGNSAYSNTASDTTFGLTLTVTVSPSLSGSVVVSPNRASYAQGEAVTLTANPATGHVFTNWSGDASGTSSTVVIYMTASRSVVANFAINAPVLSAPTSSSGTFDLTWTFTWPCRTFPCLVSSNDYYALEESTTSPSSGYSLVGTYYVHDSPYTRTLTRGTGTYYYRVRTYTMYGYSLYSNVRTVTVTAPTLNAPSGLTATGVSTTRIDLSWIDNSSGESGFRIEQCYAGVFTTCGSYTEIAVVGANVTSYASTGLTPSRIYGYRVRAYAGASNSAYSNEAQDTTYASVPPDVPSSVTASYGYAGDQRSTSIYLSWSQTGGNFPTGYAIERCTGTSCASFAQITTVGGAARSFWNTGLASGTSYSYRIRAYNAAGWSAYSSTASARTGPAAPTGLSGYAVSSTQVNLSWTDRSSNESGFMIYRCSGLVCSSLATVGAGVTSYSNTGATPGTTYQYYVVAYEGAPYLGGTLYSDPSNTVSVSTPY